MIYRLMCAGQTRLRKLQPAHSGKTAEEPRFAPGMPKASGIMRAREAIQRKLDSRKHSMRVVDDHAPECPLDPAFVRITFSLDRDFTAV